MKKGHHQEDLGDFKISFTTHLPIIFSFHLFQWPFALLQDITWRMSHTSIIFVQGYIRKGSEQDEKGNTHEGFPMQAFSFLPTTLPLPTRFIAFPPFQVINSGSLFYLSSVCKVTNKGGREQDEKGKTHEGFPIPVFSYTPSSFFFLAHLSNFQRTNGNIQRISPLSASSARAYEKEGREKDEIGKS